jgi:hypothetical protein
VTKDLVKETLHDALYVPGDGGIDQAWSRRLGGASMELLFTLAARAGDMVIEANFHPHCSENRFRRRSSSAREYPLITGVNGTLMARDFVREYPTARARQLRPRSSGGAQRDVIPSSPGRW